jgi:hypothetical protein
MGGIRNKGKKKVKVSKERRSGRSGKIFNERRGEMTKEKNE